MATKVRDFTRSQRPRPLGEVGDRDEALHDARVGCIHPIRQGGCEGEPDEGEARQESPCSKGPLPCVPRSAFPNRRT
jgi:hypothetical protein